jgi:hypothetical protein
LKKENQKIRMNKLTTRSFSNEDQIKEFLHWRPNHEVFRMQTKPFDEKELYKSFSSFEQIGQKLNPKSKSSPKSHSMYKIIWTFQKGSFIPWIKNSQTKERKSKMSTVQRHFGNQE